MSPITTHPFSVSRGTYERYVGMLWMRKWWWVIAIPLVALVVLACVLADIRWLIVGLLYLFIITPGILSMAYFSYLITPAARYNALDKEVVITPGVGIDIRYLDNTKETEIQDEGQVTPPDDSMPPLRVLSPEHIPWRDVDSIVLGAGGYVIRLVSKPYPRFLIIPRRALATPMPFEILSHKKVKREVVDF